MFKHHTIYIAESIVREKEIAVKDLVNLNPDPQPCFVGS